MSESKYTSSSASRDDKTTTMQYKLVTSLAGNNSTVAYYEYSHGCIEIPHAIFNFTACTGGTMNSVTSYLYVV